MDGSEVVDVDASVACELVVAIVDEWEVTTAVAVLELAIDSLVKALVEVAALVVPLGNELALVLVSRSLAVVLIEVTDVDSALVEVEVSA